MVQKEIQYCPILRPSLREFSNFSEYVEKLERLYKNDYGMVKIIPPPEWKPRSSSYTPTLNRLMINSPIEQNIFGKSGIYECLHIAKKSLPYEEYKSKALELDHITQGLSGEEVEELGQFWKNIVFSPPLYGADLLNSLMEPCAGSWNLQNLNTILNYGLSQKVKGVNDPYCYVGSWKALFCWHKEDMDLSAINYVHFGKNKFWYAIRSDMGQVLEKQAQRYFPEHFSKCGQFLRHKTTLINPYILKRKHQQLVIHKAEQKENQFIIAFGGAYHSGFNFGFNLAEAVNFGTLDWLRQVTKSKHCECLRSSVKASVLEIYKNLLQSPFSETKQFLSLQNHVIQTVAEDEDSSESEDEVTKKAVKTAFTRKIKKQKKAPKKIVYNNEEFLVDNWMECEKCKTWRIVNSKKKFPHFTCKNINKRCSSKENIPKNIFTLK